MVSPPFPEGTEKKLPLLGGMTAGSNRTNAADTTAALYLGRIVSYCAYECSKALTLNAQSEGLALRTNGKASLFSQNREAVNAGSSGALNFTGTEASGADIHMSGGAIHDSLDTLYVGLPGPVGTTMGVGNLNTESYALAAEIAFSQFANLLATILLNSVNDSTRDGKENQE